MKTRRSVILRLMAWAMAVCLSIASISFQVFALAPKSMSRDEQGELDWEKAIEGVQGHHVRGTGLLGEPGTDKRWMSGGLEGKRSYIGKILVEVTGLKQSVFQSVLEQRKEREVDRIFALLHEKGAGFTRGLAIPLVPAEAVGFLLNITKYQKVEVYSSAVYANMAQVVFKKLTALPLQNPPLLAQMFLDIAFQPEDVDFASPVHCAHILDALFKLHPDIARDIVGGSLSSRYWSTFLLIYHLMPNPDVVKNCVWRPQERAQLSRLIGGEAVPPPNQLEQIVDMAYEQYLLEYQQSPSLEELMEAVAMESQQELEEPLVISFDKDSIVEAVVRLNRIYGSDVLLSDVAYGYSPERLRYLRKKRGLRGYQLAELIGVSPSVMSAYEHGHQTPLTSTLNKIAEILDVNVLYLMGSRQVGFYVAEFDRKRFRLARDAKGLTRERLAKEVGISEFTIRNWEIGAKVPTVAEKPYLEKAAKILGVTVNYFMGSENLNIVIPTFDPARMERARMGKGWSFEKAEEETGVGMAALHALESGTRKPRRKILEIIAPKYGVTYEYFMGLQDIAIKLPKFQPVRLATARIKQGLTLQELGIAMGAEWMASEIGGYESGRQKPSPETLKRLAECLHVSKDYLLGLTDDDDEIPAFIPVRLLIARGNKGLSQQALAEKTGKRQYGIAQLELGRVEPEIATVRLLAKNLDVSYGYLMGFEDLPLIQRPFDKERFIYALSRRHMSWMGVAHKAGIAIAQLEALQKGEIQAESKLLSKLEKILRLPVGYLLGIGKKDLKPALSPARLNMAMSFDPMEVEELATQMGVSLETFDRWIRQETIPSPTAIDLMAKILFVSREFLTGEEETLHRDRLLAATRFAGVTLPEHIDAKSVSAFAKATGLPYGYFTAKQDIVFPGSAISGQKIQVQRLKQNLSQEQLAGRLGTGWSRSICKSLELGYTGISLEDLDHLARELNVHPSHFMQNPQIALSACVPGAGEMVEEAL